MRDYLNANEKNQFLILISILQNIEGIRNSGVNGTQITPMREQWLKSNNLTKDEHKSLKMAETYLKKFVFSVFERLSEKDRQSIIKKGMKFDFRLIDDYTLRQLYRDINDKTRNAVVPRGQFQDWTCEIMNLKCKDCTKNWNECDLHQVFIDNFIPESSYCFENCRFAYE